MNRADAEKAIKVLEKAVKDGIICPISFSLKENDSISGKFSIDIIVSQTTVGYIDGHISIVNNSYMNLINNIMFISTAFGLEVDDFNIKFAEDHTFVPANEEEEKQHKINFDRFGNKLWDYKDGEILFKGKTVKERMEEYSMVDNTGLNLFTGTGLSTPNIEHEDNKSNDNEDDILTSIHNLRKGLLDRETKHKLEELKGFPMCLNIVAVYSSQIDTKAIPNKFELPKPPKYYVVIKQEEDYLVPVAEYREKTKNFTVGFELDKTKTNIKYIVN